MILNINPNVPGSETTLSRKIGSAWKYKDGNIGISFGAQVRSVKGDQNSELVESFQGMEIKPGDRLVLFPNSFKDDAKDPSKAPDYIVKAAVPVQKA